MERTVETMVLGGVAMGTLCLLCVACESGPTATPTAAPQTSSTPTVPTPTATTATAATATAEPTGDCVPALGAGSRTARIFGIGSHADAKTNVTIELASGKMTGTTFELDDSKVMVVEVNDTLRPEELSKLTDALKATCVVPKTPPEKAQGVPGGYSYLAIAGSAGTLWLTFGKPHEKMPAGGKYAELTREAWDRVVAAYPKLRPSERGAKPTP